MVIKKFLMLGLMIAVFGEVYSYRLDYHDLDVAQDSGSDYLSSEKHWVSGGLFDCKIGKTIRSATYGKGGAEYSVNLHIWYPNQLDLREFFFIGRYRNNDIEWRKKQLLKRGFSHKDISELDSLCCQARDDSQFSSVSLCPLIFFCSGDLGTSAGDYAAICEKLASHGFVVVAVENTHNNLISVDDVQCAYHQFWKYNHITEDMFYNQVDFDRVGIIGHLHGGSIAYQLCRKDIRFKVGVSLDGLPFGADTNMSNLYGPFLFLFSEQKMNETQAIQEMLKTGNFTQVVRPKVAIIPQLKSQGFSDLVILKDLPPYNMNKHLLDLEGMTGAVNGRETITLINKHIVDFFRIGLI